jgi:3-dehydroquinate synthetase
MKKDKKVEAGELRFVVTSGIGQAELHPLSSDQMRLLAS